MGTTNQHTKIINVYHFNNGSGGGVLSVIRNLLLYQKPGAMRHHVIYTINNDVVKNFKLPCLTGAESEHVFYYSSRWNFYYTCKKAAELLPDYSAVIVANDWLELGVVSQMGLRNPVIQILHGDYDYYYNLSVKHNEWINAFVTVANVMAFNLGKKMPDRVNDIHYLPFPVPDVKSKCFFKTNQPLQLIFVGRLTREKGYDLLPLIEKNLREKNIEVKWHIVGEVTSLEKAIWNDGSKVQFYGHMSNVDAIGLMLNMDCLVLPSIAEGMPVTVVEAMKVGLVCIVNDLPGGMQELITDGLTGYRIKNNNTMLFADAIYQLNNDGFKLKEIGEKAKSVANKMFNPSTNVQGYEQLIVKCYSTLNQQRKAVKVYGSRLDGRWIPNFVTKTIRSF